MNKIYEFAGGSSPLLISMPHAGILIPPAIAREMTAEALQIPDVDWHLPQLYAMAHANGASVLSANYMRYVIDLNRAQDDANLYPGQDTTGLCPLDTFAKAAIYQAGKTPNPAEVQRRVAQYWRPYHEKLQSELARIRELHGFAILWDAHSIASRVPRFFSGQLPDFNLGTADGLSCAASLQQDLLEKIRTSPHASLYSHVCNGRFKGGHITRHYGKPAQHIHAIQLELSQRTYMNEHAPYAYRPELAARVQPLLIELLEICLNWAGR